ncbi:MAG: ATP-binding protein, partial [Bacillota bacterium]
MDRSFRAVIRRAGKAVADHRMIGEGDRIAIGLSGGKDSLTLLHCLLHLRKVAPIRFEIAAVTISLGWDTDFSRIARHCGEAGVPFHLEETQIGPIVLEARREQNPCSLCANMKRGALHAAAARLGCNKVALAHHLDDAVETLLMNVL